MVATMWPSQARRVQRPCLELALNQGREGTATGIGTILPVLVSYRATLRVATTAAPLPPTLWTRRRSESAWRGDSKFVGAKVRITPGTSGARTHAMTGRNRGKKEEEHAGHAKQACTSRVA